MSNHITVTLHRQFFPATNLDFAERLDTYNVPIMLLISPQHTDG
jgi:hypothetical protein